MAFLRSKMICQESEKNVTPAVTAAVAQLEDDVLELLIQDEFRGKTLVANAVMSTADE